MARIIKLLKSYPAQSITTSNIELEATKLPLLGSLRGLIMSFTLTTAKGSGTYAANSGEFIGSNVYRLIKEMIVRNKNSEVVHHVKQNELMLLALEMSKFEDLDDEIDFLNASSKLVPANITADVTSQEYITYVPMPINASDLGGSAVVELTLGTLADFYATVSSSTISVTLEVYGVYGDQPIETIKTRVVRMPSTLNAEHDFKEELPNFAVPYRSLVMTTGDINPISAPTELDKTRIDTFTLRRSKSIEVEKLTDSILNDISEARYRASVKPSAMLWLPLENAVKSDDMSIIITPNNTIQPTFIVFV